MPVLVETILHIRADGDYAELHTSAGVHLVHVSLAELAGRLDPAQFARVHRSHIVNLGAVRYLRPYDDRRLAMACRGRLGGRGQPLRLGRSAPPSAVMLALSRSGSPRFAASGTAKASEVRPPLGQRHSFPSGCPLPNPLAAHRLEGVVEHVVGDAAALGDALGLVERPVDAEVDAALAVLLLGLRERGEAAREERPHVAVVVRASRR